MCFIQFCKHIISTLEREMNNNKFKLSNMIPNAWFYKLRDMGKNNRYRNKKTQATSSSSSSFSNSSSMFSSTCSTDSYSTKTIQPQMSNHRQSYYFSRDLSPPHSRSSVVETKLPNAPTNSGSVNSFSVSNFKSFDTTSENKSPDSPKTSPKLKIRNREPSNKGNFPIPISDDPKKGFCNTNLNSSNNNFVGLNPVSETKLPKSPIRTPKQKIRNRSLSDKSNSQIVVSNTNFKNLDSNADGFYPISKPELLRITIKKKPEAKKEKKINPLRKQRNSPVSRHSVNSTGVKLRSNSPRIGKITESGRKSFSSGGRRKQPESFAVVKSSSDPEKDFRESMVEMILKNDIICSSELEDLLACYLQLNCDEYHEIIIKVFKQIWFDLDNVSI